VVVANRVTLRARLEVGLGGLHLDLELAAAASEIVAVVGPNGAGKTTMLRALAGLLPLSAGRVEVDGMLLEDVAVGLRLATEARPVGVVFQEYLLFPHMSVLDNVAYGLRARGVGAAGARLRAGEWLERFGLSAAARRRPGDLSGGQAQRVALARALAIAPGLLLLDEPLAAIDAGARAGLRRDLRGHLAAVEGVRILVTHDPVDAIALADRLVVLEGGRITQEGSLAEVTARPRSPWVARLLGLNLYRGVITDNLLGLAGGANIHLATDLAGPAFAVVHPRAVSLHRLQPEGSPRNAFFGTIGEIDYAGDRVRVQVEGQISVVAEVTTRAAVELRLADGGSAWATIKATEIDVYPT
jgi:molybdate transport system ATP-binding protein